MLFNGVKNVDQWTRLSGFVRSKLVEWKVSKLCASIDATTPSPQQTDVFLKAKGTFALEFSDMSSLNPQVAEFEGVTPLIQPISQEEANKLCSAGTSRLWSADGVDELAKAPSPPWTLWVTAAGLLSVGLVVVSWRRRSLSSLEEAVELLEKEGATSFS